VKMRMHVVGWYELDENLKERKHAYGSIHPDECARHDMKSGRESPVLMISCCDDVELVSVEPVFKDTIYERARELLGKTVNVHLGEHRPNELLDGGATHCQCGAEMPCDKSGKRVIARGKLLGFGADGAFELLQDDGTIHWCWPMLEIDEFPKGQTTTEDK